ncbi:MAG: helix-turn-helix domain-containing protein [Paludibacteraceae bacterium]
MKQMLLSTDVSAKELADRFHFDTTSYMGRYFRRHTGTTPTEFRLRYSAGHLHNKRTTNI